MTRETIDLCGPWRFLPDASGEGEVAEWFAGGRDASRWTPVTVPTAFDRCLPGLEGYEGRGWFRRGVVVPASWAERRVAVRFEGVNYHARVWVNGVPVGENGDGFLPFEFAVGPALRFGEANEIVVCADNLRWPEDVPGRERGWRPFGGILREVSLVSTPRLHLDGPHVQADLSGAVRVRVAVTNESGERATARVALSVRDRRGREVLAVASENLVIDAGQVEAVTLAGSVPDFEAWSPDDPALYSARVELRVRDETVDAVDSRFGFRRLETDGCRLMLNGRRVFLVGFNRHEDSPRTDACMDLATVRSDLEAMKAMGANFVRLAHYPHHPGELDLCDELGLLVMGEIPLYWWRGEEDGEETCARKLTTAKRQLTRMITRDWNHPSVVFWSVSNETREDLAEVREGNATLVQLARELDPTRLAVHVSNHWPRPGAFDEDDVVCVNAYPTWNGRLNRSNPSYDLADAARWWEAHLAELHAHYPDRPILVTEFGFMSWEGVHDGPLSEEFHARVIETESEGMHADYVCGAVIWCWADHPWPQCESCGPNRVGLSPFGVVTRERKRLKAWEAARGVFERARND